MKLSKQARLTEALKSGKSLTVAQIRSQFKLANPTATISDIRETGFKIKTVRTVMSNGRTVVKYVSGRQAARA